MKRSDTLYHLQRKYGTGNKAPWKQVANDELGLPAAYVRDASRPPKRSFKTTIEGKDMQKFSSQIKVGTSVKTEGLNGWHKVEFVHPTRKWVKLEGVGGMFQRGHIKQYTNGINHG